MISVAAYVAMLAGIVIYKSCLSSYEPRTMLAISSVIGMIGSFFSLILVLQWNLKIGISNLVFVYFTDTFTVALAQAFYLIPSTAFFAKIIPTRVEGTLFAFIMSIMNLTTTFSKISGGLINSLFFHVTTDNLDDLWKNYLT